MSVDTLEGRLAVVTGGARGIGDAVVRALSARGARVAVLDMTEPPEPRDGARYVVADVSDPKSVEHAFASVDAEEGRVDILVNNAGIQRVGLTGQLPYDDWSAVIG